MNVFERRVRRAEQLATEWPFAAGMMRFYRGIFKLQGQIYNDLLASPSPDVERMASHFDPFMDFVLEEGPPELAKAAKTIGGKLGPLLVRFESGDPPEDPVLQFFPRAIHPSLAMSSNHRHPRTPVVGEAQDHCPLCAKPPQVSVLREDKTAETVRRTLVCSICSHEWDFPRVLCPGCKEERPEKLPRLTAQEIPWMRVEACDSCGKYIKSVDLTLNWDAEPVVDELASTPLDVIAREHGYTKIAPNLAGI